MSEPDLSELQTLAEAAKQVLDNPAFNAAFKQLNQAYWEQFAKSPLEAKDFREHLHAKLQYGQEFLKSIELILNSFEVALLQKTNAEQAGM